MPKNIEPNMRMALQIQNDKSYMCITAMIIITYNRKKKRREAEHTRIEQ